MSRRRAPYALADAQGHVPSGDTDNGQRCPTLIDAAGSPGTVMRSPEDRVVRRNTSIRGSGCEREPGESPGLSRSGEWERPPS